MYRYSSMEQLMVRLEKNTELYSKIVSVFKRRRRRNVSSIMNAIASIFAVSIIFPNSYGTISFNIFAILLAAYTIYDIIKVELISLNPKSLTSLIITLIFIMDIAEKDVWYIRDTVALMSTHSFEGKELDIVQIFYNKLCNRVEHLEKI